MNASGVTRAAAALVMCTVGLVALNFADASPRDVRHDLAPLVLLAMSYFFALILLTYTSLASDMRLSFQVMLIYFVVYLILPGYSHASRNLYPFFDLSYGRDIRFDASLVVLVFLVSTFLGSLFVQTRAGKDATLTQPGDRYRHGIIPNGRLAVVTLIISAASAALFVGVLGFSFAFAPRIVGNGIEIDTQSIGFVISLPRALTIIPFVYALVLIRFSARKSYGYRLLLANLPFLLVTNWPPALPRSQIFGLGLLIAVLLIDFKASRQRAILSLAFLGGAIVGMPLVDHFTRGKGTLETLNMTKIFSAFFQSGDFDGLQSINNAIVYVHANGPQYGQQLLSAILFFVPRAIWTGKADASGSIAARAAGYKFLNVSEPLPGEFFIDFNYVGVVVGGILTGVLLSRVDRSIDAGWRTDPRTRLVAGLFVAYALPLYRGALLGVVAPFAMLAVMFWLLAKFGMRPAPAPAAR